MCGIAGLIDFRRKSSEALLRQCTDVLQHRGPDGSGTLFFETDQAQVGLGHRRLSIIDLSAAASQPMSYRHYHIVFNGEMYNYAEVRAELEKAGHQFVTHSDTEVILHAWETWGTDMIHHFIGMYAFTLYDAAQQCIYIYRDRPGVKPLYYYWHDGLFLFASELKSFHQHPGFRKQLHHPALQQFLQYGYILAPLSIFEHTKKLLPGHFLTIDLKKQSVEEHTYWNVYDAYNKPKLSISEPDAIEETRKLLLSACRYRMVADVPVGVFLSGGYDSSAVTALLQTSQTEKLKTFTIGFHESDHNEAPFARKVAEHLQTDHYDYYCTTKEAQEIIPDIPFYCDEPFGDSSIIPTTLVSRLARQQVTVALSADAGDETFAGYSKYPISLDIQKKIGLIPPVMRKTAGSLLRYVPDNLLQTITGNQSFAVKKRRLAHIIKQKDSSASHIMDHLLSQVADQDQLMQLLRKQSDRPWSYFHTEHELQPSLSQLDRMLAIDYKTYLPDDILVKVDRAGMSVSLEGREPLLDHRLIEWSAALPDTLKLKGVSSKYILRQVVHQYLPKEIMERPKMGFGVPVFQWLRTDLRWYVDEYFSDAALQHGYFDGSTVRLITNRFLAGDRNYNNLFWYLLMFQLWYKKWMA